MMCECVFFAPEIGEEFSKPGIQWSEGNELISIRKSVPDQKSPARVFWSREV
jgi:hypothetical protein